MAKTKQSTLDYRIMVLAFRVRDFFKPRRHVLAEAGIRPGDCVLDFGCGPGSYIVPVAGLVGPAGEIIALDIHRLAIKYVENIAFKHHLKNVRTVRSGLKTGLPDAGVDVVLLYDTYHDLSRPADVLAELARVLKPGGILSFSDHHLPDQDIVAAVTGSGLFKLEHRGKFVFTFRPAGAAAS